MTEEDRMELIKEGIEDTKKSIKYFLLGILSGSVIIFVLAITILIMIQILSE